MKKHSTISLSLFFILFFLNPTDAQTKRKTYIKDGERFSVGFVLGLNSSQIDGDFFQGFDKKGLTGGIRGIVRLRPRLDFNMELLYSKKGSKIHHNRVKTAVPLNKDRIIDLTYIDVPFTFKYLLKEQLSSWYIEGGAIYGRLVDTKITEKVNDSTREFAYENIVKDFDKDDIYGMAGLGYYWKKGFALGFRYTISGKKFYKNSNYLTPTLGALVQEEVEFLRNYYFSIILSYTIF